MESRLVPRLGQRSRSAEQSIETRIEKHSINRQINIFRHIVIKQYWLSVLDTFIRVHPSIKSESFQCVKPCVCTTAIQYFDDIPLQILCETCLRLQQLLRDFVQTFLSVMTFIHCMQYVFLTNYHCASNKAMTEHISKYFRGLFFNGCLFIIGNRSDYLHKFHEIRGHLILN